MAVKEGIWDTIQKRWELNKETNRELAREFGVSHVAIGKRAAGSPDKHGNPTRPVWKRRLAQAITERTAEILATDGVLSPDEKKTVEDAAQRNADVYRTHQKEIREFKEELDETRQLLKRKLAIIKAIRSGGPTDSELVMVAKLRESFVKQLQILHDMERKAFSLDKDAAKDDTEDIEDRDLARAVADLLRGANRGADSDALA